MLGQIVQASTG